jgi:2-methylcitrate dehydratase PrpD
LMNSVRMTVDPELTADRPVTESFERGTIDVTLKGGEHRRAAVLTPRGHPDAPLSDAELEEKFRDCASGALAPATIDTVLSRLMAFDCVERIEALLAELTPQ